MISVHEAEVLILHHTIDLSTEVVPLPESLARVLCEPLIADRDFPPYDRVTMDGIAISYEAFKAGSRVFRVAGTVAAGMAAASLDDNSACLEIMTGAMLPEGCDTVVRYEDIELQDGVAHMRTDNIRQGQNVHRRGEDRTSGQVIVPAGQRITAAEIGIAAAVGKSELIVKAFPKIVAISTGDELVDIDTTPEPHQIRKSNVYQIAALLANHGVQSPMVHLSDNEKVIRQTLAEILTQHDAIVLSGGVSAGRFDFIPKVLVSLGVREVFHKVAQRPGKPFWFGISDQGKPVFALPGNPVSSFMCVVRYVIPWLYASMGIRTQPCFAMLEIDFVFTPPLTGFIPVSLSWSKEGTCFAKPVAGHGSGDLANLVDADAFVELPSGKDTYAKGESCRIWQFR